MKNALNFFRIGFLLFFIGICSGVYAQKTITGTVTDEYGEEIVGASISVKGTTTGTATDASGKFTIQATEGATLIISYIGYRAQEVVISSVNTLKIKLVEDVSLLDEVIVVGYGTQRKASLTSAISQISGEEAFKDRGLGNVSIALQGTMPGLVVTRTTTRPGSENVNMQIRGSISIQGDSSPLVIIDGVSGSMDELNQMDPNDIENISVLKDASAAIYGVRSASGVLLVTTKRGEKGATKISYNGLFSTTIDGIRPPITTNEEWLDMFYEAQYQDARANRPDLAYDHEAIMTVFDWWVFGNGVIGGLEESTGINYTRYDMWKALRTGQTLTLNSGATKVQRLEPGHYIMDELFGQATWQKHSLSVSGADDRFGYMLSLGYANNNSQLKLDTDGEKRYTARINMDYQANQMLKLETGMSFERRNIRATAFPFGAGNSGWMDFWFWPFYNEAGQPYDTFSGQRNPIAGVSLLGHNKNYYTTIRMNMKAIINLSKFVKGLSVTTSGGFRSLQRDTQQLRNPIQFYDWVGNYQGSRTGEGNPENIPSFLSEELQKYETVTLGAFANYENVFSNVYRVSAMVGITSEEENNKRVFARRRNGPTFDNSGLVDLDVFNSGTNNSADGGQSSWAFLSYITRLNFAYSDKYLVEFLARRDGSSRLYPEHRWKNFYSISGGWVISQENFMQGVPWLSFLKVRYNYGLTGSVEGISNYEPFSQVIDGNAYFGSTLAAQPSLRLSDTMTSSTRTWETIVKHNAGMDFAFLRNRLSGSFDYFSNTNNGMFISVTYPSVLGATAPTSNNGKFQTKGWELSLDWRDRIGNLTYHVGGFLADASSEVVELLNNENVPNPGKNNNRLIGMPREAIYVYKTSGIFQTQEEADSYYDKYYWKPDRSGPKEGNILPAPAATGLNRLRPGARILTDSNGDGAITLADLVFAGDAAPRMTFGIRTGMEWKGFDVNALFQGVWKQVVLRGGQFYAPWHAQHTLQNSIFMGKLWSDIDIKNPLDENQNLVNKNLTNDYAIASRNNAFSQFNYLNKDVSVSNSRYIRLKSFVVGYKLPQTLTSRISIDRARVYFSGDDLWEWSKIKDGFDPEHGEASNNIFPFSRLISVGLDITF